MLRCRHVTKRYGKFTALQDLSLEVYEGEIFALLGPNGAGKSTLIHCITGLAKQSEGSIEVLGFDTLHDFRTTRRLVGLVPQEITYDPFFTPLESLMIQMGLMGVEPNRVRAENLLKTFALDEKRDAYTRTLSGGMKDVELRRELWREVEELRAAGTTIVLTTHYIEEAERLADRIGILHKGELLLVESRDSLLERHGGRSLEDIYVELIRKADGRPMA
ncbi:MAG: ABC transporter ATP-binding protein [Deltaproteobacteria bacterium]|nr:ABC transporter ATP-binding protein [Deltaproteobacteria bacterium]